MRQKMSSVYYTYNVDRAEDGGWEGVYNGYM